MADKNTYEAGLAEAVHQAEQEYAKANAAGAGPNRIDRINRAASDLCKAEAAYEHCRRGIAY